MVPYVRYDPAVPAAPSPVVAILTKDRPGGSAGDRCPRGATIVGQVDGGLARVHVPAGRLRAGQARALADLAGAHGSGVIELTNRGNLQLRGIRSEGIDALTTGLVDAGLLDLEDHGRTGRIVSSSLTGLDPNEPPALAEVVARIVAAFDGTELEHLAPKFAVLVDGGGPHGLTHRPFDLTVSVEPTPTAGRSVLVAFGSPLHPATGPGRAVRVHELVVPGLIRTVARACIEGRPPRTTRVRDLVDERGWAAFVAALAPAVGAPLDVVRAPAGTPRPLAAGAHRQVGEGLVFVVATAALGRVTADELRSVVCIAEEHGCGELRVTPWRALAVPDVRAERAAVVIERLASVGLRVDADDPATRVVACSGSTGCAAGFVDAQADARRVLDGVGHGTGTIHVSGCAKRCACPEQAAIELVGVDGGGYEVWHHGEVVVAGATRDEAVRGAIEVDRGEPR